MPVELRIRIPSLLPTLLLLSLALPSAMIGQERRSAPTVRLSSGLHTFLPGETAVVRIVETNRQAPTVDATVTFLDQENTVLSSDAGSISPGRSLSVEVPYSEPREGVIAQVRAVVQLENGHRRRNAIVVNMELFDELDLVAPGRGPTCVPYQFGTNAIPNCPGWAASFFRAEP